jgi:excisionase family DNA binding protein
MLSTDEVSALVGVHPETVNRARRKGKLPAYYVGRRCIRYALKDVQEWLAGMRYQTVVA